MAELTKLLHFLKSGTEQTAKAYSTVDEAGDNYVQGKIDGVACYAPIGATDDAMATNGRVIKGGTTYAIKSQSKPPYTEIAYTDAGTYTFTVPKGVTRLRVAVCGGGGSGAYRQTMGSSKWGNPGGISSAFGIQATGGEAATVYGSGAGGTPNGYNGITGRDYPNTKGFALSFTKTDGSYGYGSGGHHSATTQQGYGGGSGGYDSQYVNVTPLQSYSIVIGAGGASTHSNVKNGGGGFVLIAYGGDI